MRASLLCDGVVDIYLMPAYEDIASLYLVNGKWQLHYVLPDTTADATIRQAKPLPVSKDALGRILNEMSINASSAL